MLLLLLLNLFSFVSIAISGDCTVSTNKDLGEPQPLIVNSNYTIKHPQETDVVSFYENEYFILSCPGSNLQLKNGTQQISLSEHEIASCTNNKQFTIISINTVVIFTDITCARYPIDIIRATSQTCEGGNQEIEIGFLVNSSYIRHLAICFDKYVQTTINSHYELLPNIRGRQSGFPRPSWINDRFYEFGSNSSNSNADTLYVRGNQIATISKLIGFNDTTRNPYVNNTGNLYLARGHLTAKADFTFGAQQRLTFHLINAAPQWQSFNEKNWADLEADVRNLAIDYDLTLQVYTGTYGVMTLPHEQTKEEVKIYLYNDDRDYHQMPVPLLYYKFVYEPIDEAGIVLVGVNHPYIKNVSEAIFCQDIYESINWTTTFKRNTIIDGYMYACSPPEFNKTVRYLPNLPLKYLLTLNTSFNSIDSSGVRLPVHPFTSLVLFTMFLMYVSTPKCNVF